ncbi:hypothetical protein FIBSPDRAFT_845921 [Athelia psychrophila]|uniref:Uncharacterized protein n=1 Tax=Athelia psychrophila TaxID=1759441 RepID=A0A167SYU4_9AGAM|nr:hypothetical protein FIBSPDRAFT_845921 [Fibularhizoctonia sp. CBS 109695]
MGHGAGEPFKGHGSCIRSVACSPGGTCIASASDDCTIRMWNVEIVDCGQWTTPLGPGRRTTRHAHLRGTYYTAVLTFSLCSTAYSNIGFGHDSTLENGWIKTLSSQLLLWVWASS